MHENRLSLKPPLFTKFLLLSLNRPDFVCTLFETEALCDFYCCYLFLNKGFLCARLGDDGKVRLRCNRVKVIYMCHGTVTFRIHSTATTKETKNSIKTQGACLLGLSAPCVMSPAHLGHWVSVSCQCQDESRDANEPLPTLHLFVPFSLPLLYI